MTNLLKAISVLFVLYSCSNTHSSTQSKGTSKDEIQTLESQSKATSIKVVDTDFSKGRLTNDQELTLWDIQKMHGHLCDGLVVGFLGLREGLYQLYPDSIIDRTNTRIVAKSSPCIGDVGMYLTGGRYQFNSFYVDNNISGIYIIQRMDNGKSVIVQLKEGVKPPEIDQLGKKAVSGDLDACGLDSLRAMEDRFSHFLFESTPKNLFEIEVAEGFVWKPILTNDFKKTDVLNKNAALCD